MQEPEKIQSTKLEFDATCPSCSASIEFNPAIGKLKCPYCDYETAIAIPENEVDQVAQEIDYASAQDSGNFDWGTAVKNIICQECGAESIYDALQVADSCPYCGSNQVMEAANDETLAPNGVCAFEITKIEAGENFQKWVKGRLFMPTPAKKSAQPSSFQGVYLPYWTFDTKTSSRYAAEYGINRVVKDRNGEERIVTDWYSTSGFYQQFIDDHLVSATNRYDRSMMRKIEPFELIRNKAYRPEYLSGFMAERYSIGLEDGWSQAQQEIHQRLAQAISEKIAREQGADQVSRLQFSTTHDNVTFKYLTLPIWMSSYTYKDRVYNFMVNGQTGRVGGQAPVSPIRVAIAVFFALVVVLIVATLVSSQ